MIYFILKYFYRQMLDVIQAIFGKEATIYSLLNSVLYSEAPWKNWEFEIPVKVELIKDEVTDCVCDSIVTKRISCRRSKAKHKGEGTKKNLEI